jgi:hypothetical protein
MFKITAKEKQMVQKRRKVLSARKKKGPKKASSPQDHIFFGLDDFRDALVDAINSQEDLELDLEEAFPKEAKKFLKQWDKIYKHMDNAIKLTDNFVDEIADNIED